MTSPKRYIAVLSFFPLLLLLLSRQPAPADEPRAQPTIRSPLNQIAFNTDDGIYLISAQGNYRQQLAAISDDYFTLFLDWSPDGRRLVYSEFLYADSTTSNLYVMDVDGSNRQQLIGGPAEYGFPDWSPDGSRILFNSDRDGDWDIYTINADGTNLQQLTDFPGIEELAVWSPNGSQIAFESDQNGTYNIYVMQADGSNLRQLTANDIDSVRAAWSPDGTRIAYRTSGSAHNIFVMNADGTHQQQLTHNADIPNVMLDLDWTPDGQHIVWEESLNSWNGPFNTYIMDADGIHVIQLTENEDFPNGFSFSPDSTQIAIPITRHDQTLLFVMNLDGTDAHPLSGTEGVSVATWHPVR